MKEHKKYWRRARKSLGLCVKCGAIPALHGKKRCAVCALAKKSEKMKTHT